MPWSPVAPLVFLWWNTSLSPPIKKKKATAEDRTFVVEQIKEMRAALRFDILGLGEVDAEDLRIILDGVGDSSLSVIDVTDHSGKLMFDTAIIYDRTKLSVIELDQTQSFIEGYGKVTLKLGELVSFVTLENGAVIHLVVSHWPSRLTAGELEGRRAELGTLLRVSLARLRTDGADPFIVLMGDYNDDPFSPSLSAHLLATRDRELAKRNSKFFYNPFWRCLGESLPSAVSDTDSSVCGTHFYRNGEHTEWFTYDQIIFASAFLGDGPIILNEEHSRIVATPELKRRLRSRKHVCDHFPVLSVVTLRSQL